MKAEPISVPPSACKYPDVIHAALPEIPLIQLTVKAVIGSESGNEAITEVTFSDANTTVEEYAFMNCTSLEKVTIPKNVVDFGDRAFAQCTSLQSVTMLSEQAADIDGSGDIEITDATYIQRWLAAIETPYAINAILDRN